MTLPDATAILVAGMHRSGTSALAGALGMFGVSLGGNLLDPGGDNPKGYWEHQDAVGIHERLLEAFDRRWDDVRPLPAGWSKSDAAKEASEQISRLIQRDFAGSSVWAVKDPRICRFLPLWIDVLHELQIKPVVLLAVRKPSEVAASIESRNHWAASIGEMLWLRHVLDAEASSREVQRTVVVYDDLLSDPSTVVSSAMLRLGVQIPTLTTANDEALAQFVDRADRHHLHSAAVMENSTLAALADDAYAALVGIAHGGDVWGPLQDCAVRFDSEWRQYGVYIEAVAAMAQQFNANEMSARLDAFELSSRLNAQIQWSNEAVAIHSALQSRHDEQSTTLQALTEERDRLVRESEQLREDVEGFRQSRSWKVTRPLRALARLLRPTRGGPRD